MTPTLSAACSGSVRSDKVPSSKTSNVGTVPTPTTAGLKLATSTTRNTSVASGLNVPQAVLRREQRCLAMIWIPCWSCNCLVS